MLPVLGAARSLCPRAAFSAGPSGQAQRPSPAQVSPFSLTTHGFLVTCGLVAAIVNSRCLVWTEDSLKYSQINPGLGESQAL